MNFFKKNRGNEIVLTYAEIEKILGFQLCPSAYKYKPYWNPTKTHTITRSWIENGWKISHLELSIRQRLSCLQNIVVLPLFS